MLIERGVSFETWSIVNFDEIGVKFMVKHHIEAKNLEAHVI